MIIRRRHTADFTTIGNALFKDERLQADELGVMAFLLSKPNDWEVRRPALARRFGIGRDAIRRILRNLIRYGWIVAEMTRLSNGTVYVVYEVRDEPGPELSEDQVRNALTLGKTGEEEGAAEPDEPLAEDVAADPPAGGQPPSGQPEAVSRLRPTHPGPIETLQNPDSLNPDPQTARARGGGGVGVPFEQALAAWSAEHVASPFACEREWAKLPPSVQATAFEAMPGYRAERGRGGFKLCDLRTYIAERRWESAKARASQGKPKPVLVQAGTPQFYRWREYRAATEGERAADVMDSLARQHGFVGMPSEWPPPLPAKGGTGPPLDPVSDAELAAFR